MSTNAEGGAVLKRVGNLGLFDGVLIRFFFIIIIIVTFLFVRQFVRLFVRFVCPSV